MGKSNSSKKRFKIINLEITNACNFTCDYCPIDQQTRKKMVMPREFACNIIDQIADNDLTDFLTFHLMGEPFLHKDLGFLTGYAEDRGLMVRLLTNGSLLDTKRNEELFNNNLTRLEIGFRTPNESSFDLRLRGGSLTLDKYIRRVEGLIDDKLRLRAKTEIGIKLFIRSHAAMLKMADSYEHLSSKDDNLKIAEYFQKYILKTAKKYGLATKEWDDLPLKISPGSQLIFPGFTLGFSRIQDFWIREQQDSNDEKTYPAWVGGCSAGFREDFGILSNGQVTTCCVDYDGKNVIGDLHEQTLMDVLDSAEARRIKRSLEWFVPPTSFCKECLGGPTLLSSCVKQAATVAIDIKERLSSVRRKDYRDIRDRIKVPTE